MYEKSFGTEAINTIVQEIEKRKNNTIVIFAGYPDNMKTLLEQNECLHRRLSYYLDSPDYQADDLSKILRIMTGRRNGIRGYMLIIYCVLAWSGCPACANNVDR